MSYTRACNVCGQRISLRQMSDGHWVAFVNTQTPHAHHKKSSQQNNDTYYSKKTSNKFEWSGDNDDILLRGFI